MALEFVVVVVVVCIVLNVELLVEAVLVVVVVVVALLSLPTQPPCVIVSGRSSGFSGDLLSHSCNFPSLPLLGALRNSRLAAVKRKFGLAVAGREGRATAFSWTGRAGREEEGRAFAFPLGVGGRGLAVRLMLSSFGSATLAVRTEFGLSSG
jgi:hypothetical protein